MATIDYRIRLISETRATIGASWLQLKTHLVSPSSINGERFGRDFLSQEVIGRRDLPPDAP